MSEPRSAKNTVGRLSIGRLYKCPTPHILGDPATMGLRNNDEFA